MSEKPLTEPCAGWNVEKNAPCRPVGSTRYPAPDGSGVLCTACASRAGVEEATAELMGRFGKGKKKRKRSLEQERAARVEELRRLIRKLEKAGELQLVVRAQELLNETLLPRFAPQPAAPVEAAKLVPDETAPSLLDLLKKLGNRGDEKRGKAPTWLASGDARENGETDIDRDDNESESNALSVRADEEAPISAATPELTADELRTAALHRLKNGAGVQRVAIEEAEADDLD